MDLGAFSTSLAVKGLAISRAFCPIWDADAKAVPSFFVAQHV